MKKITLSLLLITFLGLNFSLAQNCSFKEAGGLLVVETESAVIPKDWVISSKGDLTFIEWNGAKHLYDPGNGAITYKLNFTTPGIYRIQWHNKINKGPNPGRNDNNDSWMKLPNTQDIMFFGHLGASSSIESDLQAKNSKVVFPAGSDLGQDANGSIGDWMKLYINILEWSWSTDVNDEEPYALYVKVNKAGTYDMQISARDTEHALDKVVFYNINTFGDDLSSEELDGFKESNNNCPSAKPVVNNEDGKCEFEEVNGVVLIEAESNNVPDAWNTTKEEDDVFIEWTDKEEFDIPGKGPITYFVSIATTGLYRIQFRNKIRKETNTSQNNDTWIKILNTDDVVFFGYDRGASSSAAAIKNALAKKSSTVVFPKGSGLGNPITGSIGDWVKIYNFATTWSWTTYVNDEKPHNAYVQFKKPGIYEIQVSGRAKHHALDKIVFYQIEDKFENDLDNDALDAFAESGCLPKLAYTNTSAGDSLALRLLHERTSGGSWSSPWNLNQPMNQWAGVKLDTGRRVVELSLVNRNIIGALPSELSHLSKLKKLEIKNNTQLSARFPDLTNMSDLTVLDLSGNGISGDIGQLGKVTKLTMLKLNNNQMSGSIPADINKLTNLTVLELQNNEFGGNIPAGISNLKKFVTFNLANNNFTGNMPAIGAGGSVKTFDVSNNNDLAGDFSALGIQTLTNLEILSIGNNAFTGEIFPGLVNLTKLKTLNLGNNQLTGGVPANIGNLVNLTTIDLSGNQFTGVFPATFSQLTKLTSALFNNNMLEGALPPINGLTQLTTLALHNNLLSDLPDLSASAITNLSVENNKLTFEDIIPAANKLTSYAPQDSVGEVRSVTLLGGKQLVIDLGIDKSVESSFYVWSRNGTFYKNTVESQLIINNVAVQDTGSYTCVITNSILTDLTLYSNPVNVIVNAPPAFTSTPVTTATSDSVYTYNIEVEDQNNDDSVTVTAVKLPKWLTFNKAEDGSMSLTGTPTLGDCSDNQVTLRAVDKGGLDTLQTFTIDIAINFAVSVTSNKEVICKGEPITFNAALSNPGENPKYEWILNDKPIEGLNGATLTTSALKTGDVLKLRVTTDAAPCLVNTVAESAPIAIEVIDITTMAIVLSAEETDLCAGEPATFTSILANPGLNPVYQWLVNDAPVEGATTATYTSSSLADGDAIKVKVTAENPGCLQNTEAESQPVSVNVKPSLILNVAIAADKTEAKAGDPVKFTATTEYSASNISFVWLVNGEEVPEVSESTFVSSTLSDNDKVKVKLSADSVTCLLNPVVESEEITMTIDADIQLSTIEKTTNEGGELTFASEDFSAAYTSATGGALASIKITVLPSQGTLTYNGANVSVGQEIAVNNIVNLKYTPNAGFAGTDTFKWNGTEGSQFAGGDAEVNITIELVNDPPVFTLSKDTLIVKQGFDSTEVIEVIPGEIPAGEADQVVTYSLNPSSISFAHVDIDPNTGKVSITSIGGRVGTQMIAVVADDGQEENNTYSQSFLLEIRSSLNTSPLDIKLSSFNIPENQPAGSTIATINVIDNDANDVHQIEFLQNDMYPDNALFSIDGYDLKNNEELNFEGKNRMFLNLKATDRAGNSLSKQIVINITDVNDTPSDIVISSLNIVESLTVGGVAAEFTTNDQDPNDRHTYTLVGEAKDNPRFLITGSKLIVNSTTAMSAGEEVQIRVRTDDGKEGALEKDFTLKVVSPEDVFADIKTGFTPNGDAWNDTWKIDNIESYPNARVEIFDSWGRRVFYSVGYENEWDGTFEGKALPAGTYYYIIDTYAGEPAKGTITIMR